MAKYTVSLALDCRVDAEVEAVDTAIEAAKAGEAEWKGKQTYSVGNIREVRDA